MELQPNTPPQANNLPEPPRKPYHPPQVTLYGNLTELTQQDPNPARSLLGPLDGPMGGSGGAP
jgi:hypothetical protein